MPSALKTLLHASSAGLIVVIVSAVAIAPRNFSDDPQTVQRTAVIHLDLGRQMKE